MSAPARGAGRLRTAAAVGGGVLLLFSTPFLIHLSSSGKPRVDPNKPLKQEAVRRGAFNNSGSVDAGPEYVIGFTSDTALLWVLVRSWEESARV